jgi:hypothetical protein
MMQHRIACHRERDRFPGFPADRLNRRNQKRPGGKAAPLPERLDSLISPIESAVLLACRFER